MPSERRCEADECQARPGGARFCEKHRPPKPQEINVSCNACSYGVDFVRSGGGMPVRVLQMSWDEIEVLITGRGRDLVGKEAADLAKQLVGKSDSDEE